MGSTRLWLPSRRSVANQRGALSTVLLGHCRSGRCSGWNLLYFFHGSLSLYTGEAKPISLNCEQQSWAPGRCADGALTWAS